MKLFENKFQHRLTSGITGAYIMVNIVNLIFTYYNDINNALNIIYIVLTCAAIIILVFHKIIKIYWRGLVLAMIFATTGIVEYYFLDNYKGYFLCILAFLVASINLRQRYAIILWAATIGSIASIGLLRMYGASAFPNLANTDNLIFGRWLERMIIFAALTGFLTVALSSLRGFILNLIKNSDQEKTKYKPLFDQTYSFITMLDNKGRIIESNQAALYYIQKKNAEIKGQFFPDIDFWSHIKEERDRLIKNLNAAMNGDFRRFEVTHYGVDGSKDHFDYTLKPIFDESYNIKYIIVEARNITAFKKTKEALLEGEERLLALTESTYEGIVISLDGRIVEANQSALKLFLIEKQEDIIGQNVIEKYIVKEEREKVWNHVRNNFYKAYETRAIREDGVIIPVELEGRNIFYKGKQHRVSAIRDLTERKIAQQALVNSEEKYRLITENINDIICKLDEKLLFTYASNSVYNMLGYTVDEMENISLRDITTRDSFGRLITNLNEKKKQIKMESPEAWNGVSFEAVLKHKSGKLLWTHINAKLVRWGKDNSYEILCVARNIDTIKKIQFSLEESENSLKVQNEEYERLNKELTSLNERLLQAKFKAEESDKLKSAFLANMSHEIRTPMNSIIGFSKMFKTIDIDEEKRSKYADFVVSNGVQLLNIVNDILDLSKIESNQIYLKKEVFNLNELIKNLHTEMVEKNHKGLMIQQSRPLKDEEANIYTDPKRLLQVLRNLTNNAYKFTKKGAVKVGYQILNESIIFFVEDTGIGIPSEQQDKIFERFRQVELDASRVFGGAGLGLSISKKMVELMGGKIWLISEWGKGSTFYVSIPFEHNLPAPSDTPHEEVIKKPPLVLSENTILVAEDDESNYFYLKELLSEQKLTIIRAKNGQEAVNIATNNPNLQLIFMDIKMPIMDGFEATEKIRITHPNIPIIAQTAFAMADDRETALKNGCTDYISKPISPEILFEMLDKYLN